MACEQNLADGVFCGFESSIMILKGFSPETFGYTFFFRVKIKLHEILKLLTPGETLRKRRPYGVPVHFENLTF